MRPGDKVKVVKGEHAGEHGAVTGSDSYFYHVRLSGAGEQVPLSFHRSQVMLVEGANDSSRRPAKR